jgi:hypothetical protein
MNLFKGLLFLEGHFSDTTFLTEDFGEHYGAQAAAQRMFAERWSESSGKRRHDVAPSGDAPSPAGCG